MHLLAPQHAEALTDERTWRDNPFVARDARRDTKRRQPFRSFLWMCGTLLLFGGLGLWLLKLLYTAGYRVPWFLGGELGTAICILVCGIHVWFISGAAQKHALRFFTQEASQDTLSTLLLLPMPPFQLALASVVFPWLAAMRMAVALLPVYVFCVGLDGISWGDLIMLYLVFALSAVALPLWYRPALSENIAEVTPSAEKSGAFRAVTTQRPTTPRRVLPFGSWLSYACFLLLEAMVFTLRSGGATGLTRYIPVSLFSLIPSSLLSWPLLMARGLITPFDWFGWAVLPLPFVLVGFVVSRYANLVRISEYLSVGSYRDLVRTPTYQPRRRLEIALRLAGSFVMAGYLWKWGVQDNGLAFVTPGGSGMLGFAYLLLMATLCGAMFRAGTLGGWLSPFKVEADDVAVRRMSTASALRYLAAPFLYGGLFYLLCCLLARTAPFPPPVVTLAGRMLAIGLPGLAVWYGSARTWKLLPLFGVALAIFVLFGPPEARPYAFFSPLLGLFHQGNLGLIGLGGRLPSPALWPQWARSGCLLGGLLLFTAALRSRRGRAPKLTPQVMQIDPTQAGMEAFADAPAVEKKRKADTPLALRLIAELQRVWDNAVAVKELRARLRGRLDRATVLIAFGSSLAITLILTLGIPIIAEVFGGRLREGSMGQVSPRAQPLADGTVCWYLVMFLLAVTMGLNILPKVFAVECEKSTLDFLLVTPMSSPAIVLGKAVGLLLSDGLALIWMGLWTLLLSLLLTVVTLSLSPLLAWFLMILMIVGLWLLSGMTAIAIASYFPRMVASGVRTFLMVFVIYGFLGLFFGLPSLFLLIGAFVVLPGHLFWGFCAAAWFALAALAALFATGGVRRMRRGDIAFGQVKRGN
jgi:hypothetical protein